MSFPRYPNYKASGVEWLGEVPEGWTVKRLGYIARSGMGQTILRDMLEIEPSAESLPVYSASEGDEVFGYFLNPAIILRSGDLVVGARGSIGMTRRITTTATCTQTTIWLKPTDTSVDSGFLYWCMVGGREELFPFDKTAIPMLTVEQVRSGRVPFPPLAEQTTIAEFLDRETGKIDELVAEQRRLMELLKEKRQAVISHAVTKGLNPHAPMKPSGIEWLGDVPVGWEVMSLKRDLDYLTSGSRGWAENYSAKGELFIRIANLTRGTVGLDLTDIQRVEVPEGAEGSRTKVKPGDVLFSITAYLGSVAVVPDGLESAYVSQHIALARLRKLRLSSKWVGYVALSVVGQTWFDTKSYGGTKIQLSLDDVRDLPIPVPSLVEQTAIVEFLETELTKFDTLTAEAQRAIDLLQERRTALISAAVTGQIDVRNPSQKH